MNLPASVPGRDALLERHWLSTLWRMAVAAAVVVALVTMAATWWLERERRAQEAVNAVVRAEIEGLDAELKQIASMRQDIAEWTEIRANAARWKGQRQWPARLLRMSARARPDGVRLLAVRETERGLSLSGHAKDHDGVAALADALERGGDVQRVDVVALQLDDRGGGLRFTLEADVGDALRPLARLSTPRVARARAEDPK